MSFDPFLPRGQEWFIIGQGRLMEDVIVKLHAVMSVMQTYRDPCRV